MIRLAALCLMVAASGVRAAQSWAPSVEAFGALKFEAAPRPAPQAAAARLRAVLAARLSRNAVAREFAAPLLDGSVVVELKTEAEEPGLKEGWAFYQRDKKRLVLNRDAIAQEAAEKLDESSFSKLADRYMPVVVHELTHARHYRELADLLRHPAPNVRETEVYALWLEAMTAAWERKGDPDYLKDGGAYASGESALVTKYWQAKSGGDFSVFRTYVDAVPGYQKIAAAQDKGDACVVAYYAREQARLLEADRRLVGAAVPSDERRNPLRDEPRFGRH